jgi:hypothetical protein
MIYASSFFTISTLSFLYIAPSYISISSSISTHSIISLISSTTFSSSALIYEHMYHCLISKDSSYLIIIYFILYPHIPKVFNETICSNIYLFILATNFLSITNLINLFALFILFESMLNIDSNPLVSGPNLISISLDILISLPSLLSISNYFVFIFILLTIVIFSIFSINLIHT